MKSNHLTRSFHRRVGYSLSTASTVAAILGADGAGPIQRQAPRNLAWPSFPRTPLEPWLLPQTATSGALAWQGAGGLPDPGFLLPRVPFTAPWWNIKERSPAAGRVSAEARAAGGCGPAGVQGCVAGLYPGREEPRNHRLLAPAVSRGKNRLLPSGRGRKRGPLTAACSRGQGDGSCT